MIVHGHSLWSQWTTLTTWRIIHGDDEGKEKNSLSLLIYRQIFWLYCSERRVWWLAAHSHLNHKNTINNVQLILINILHKACLTDTLVRAYWFKLFRVISQRQCILINHEYFLILIFTLGRSKIFRTWQKRVIRQFNLYRPEVNIPYWGRIFFFILCSVFFVYWVTLGQSHSFSIRLDAGTISSLEK